MDTRLMCIGGNRTEVGSRTFEEAEKASATAAVVVPLFVWSLLIVCGFLV